MAPRRPGRITRSGASHNTPVTPRSKKRSRKMGTSTRTPIAGSNATLSKSPEPGPAEPIDLEDVCSDLSSLSSSPRQGFTEPISALDRPSQSPNTSSKVESGTAPLERATLAEIPTRALQTTRNHTGRTRILLDTLVRDVEIPPTDPSAILDRHHPTSTPLGVPHLFWQPHPAPFPSDHKGPDSGGISLLSPPSSGVAPEGSPPVAHQLAEKCVAMRPVLAHVPIPAEPAIATSPSASTHDFAPPPSLQCAGEIPAAYQGDSIVSNYSPNLNLHSPPQYLPSTPQRSIFLTDTHSCTADYSPPASRLHSRAPSEGTIDLCFTLTKRKETPSLQNSPVSSGFHNRAPSPLSAVLPSHAIPSVDPSGTPHHKAPERESINLTTGDHVASTSPLGSAPSVELGMDNCAFPRPLRTVMRSHTTSLHAILAQRALQPPFPFHSAPFRTPSPPLDSVANQHAEQEQEEGRCTPTSAHHHEPEEEQQEREDTPLSYIVSETTQEDMRSTSGDSFVLSTTSPFLQPASKVSFVSSSIAYQVASGQKSILPASSTDGTYGETSVVDVGVEGLPTPSASVRDPDSVTLKTPRGLLKKKATFYPSVRKRRIFRKDELADSQAQSNLPIRSCVPLPALTDNEEGGEGPIQWTPNSKRSKVVHSMADSDPEEDGSTSESTPLEQQRWRWRRRRPPLVQSSNPVVEWEASGEKDIEATLGSTAAAPIVLDSGAETEVDVHPVGSQSVISISSGDGEWEEEAEAELPITIFERSRQESTVPAPRGRFLCVEVPTLRQLQRARVQAAGKLARNWTGKGNLRQTSWTLGVASRTAFSPRRPRLLSSPSPSEDELNWNEQDGQDEDSEVVIVPDYTQRLQRTHPKRFGDAKTFKSATPSSRPPAHFSPRKRKRMDTDGEGDTDELDEWVPEPVLPALGPAKRKVTPDTETNSPTTGTVLRPTPSVRRPRTINRGGPTVVHFQCTIPGASFTRPPLEPFRNSVTQANASINASTIHAPRFIARGSSSASFGCHNCRSSTDRNIKIRCSNFDRDTGGQCMHHWCERCLVLWYGFDGRGLLSAYAFSGEGLGPRETRALGERGTDGGVGLGLGVIPGKWICPHCVGKCMCTYCTKKDGRARSRFKSDTVGIPLDLDGLEGLEAAPGLRGVRPKEKKKQIGAPEISLAQSITPSLVSVAGLSTQNGESSTSNSTPGPPVPKRPRITRELQDLFTPEFGHAVHVNGHGELQIYKQDAAGNVVCVGVPTRMRTRACPDGAPESMGGIGVSATELYKPVFLPGERERWRKEVGLVEESPGSDSEVDADRSVLGDVAHGLVLVDGSEGLPRRANFVNVPWGAKLPRAQKRADMAAQAKPENAGEGDISSITAQASGGNVESRGNLGHYVEPGLTRPQFDISSVFNFGAEAEQGAAGDTDLQGEEPLTSTDGLETALYAMEPLSQVPPTGTVAPACLHPALDLTPTGQEWGSWETMALEFGDPSFNPVPSCGPLAVYDAPAGAPDASSQSFGTLVQ